MSARADAAPVDLFSQQAANRRRSRWLVTVFVLFFAWLGFGGDFIGYELTRDAPPGAYHHVVPWLGLVMVAVAAAIAMAAIHSGAKTVLWSAGAREVVEPATPGEKQLVNVVEEMAIASGLPRPRIWIVPDPDPNAFATGRDELSAQIAVTEGLLATCTRDELQAVVAHEMGHVKNLDVRLSTLVAALVGVVALVADGMWRALRLGVRLPVGGSGSRGSRSRDKDGGGLGPLMLVVIALWVLSWLFAPIVTRLLAMSVNRRREYLADAMSAQFTRNPAALASALEKLEAAAAPTRAIKRGAAHLCIVDPLGRAVNQREGRLADLLATHPPISTRIERLRAMSYQAGPTTAGLRQPDAAAGARHST